MITAARSRQIRFTMIIQNFAQLNKVYGKDDAETIKGNCGNIVYLISTELAALEEISKLCGEKKSKKDDKTASTPLVTVSDLQRMKQFDHILLRMRKSPFKTSFVPDFKIDWGKEVSPKIEYPVREKKPVQIFDIREFVKEKKNQKINEMMASISTSQVAKASSASSTTSTSTEPKDLTLDQSKPKQNKGYTVNDLVKQIDERLEQIEEKEKAKPKTYEEEETVSYGRGLGGSSRKEEDDYYNYSVTEEVETTPKKKPDTSYNNLFGGDFVRAIEERVNRKLNQDYSAENVTEVITEPVVETTPVTEPVKIIATEPVTEPSYVKTEQVIKSIQEDKQVNEQQKMYQSGFKPTVTIKLDDQQTEDNFFDDFFDD